jgi:hypothetical protein
VLAVHQLRYQLAFGSQSGHELSAQGHAYLGLLAPLVALALAIGLGSILASMTEAWRNGRVKHSHSRRVLAAWLLVAVGLVAVYVAQESLEGVLSSGHPSGLAGVFGDGGWLAIPIAMAIAGVIALTLQGAGATERWLARRAPQARPNQRRAIASQGPLPVWIAAAGPLASKAAGRAPPREAPTLI